MLNKSAANTGNYIVLKSDKLLRLENLPFASVRALAITWQQTKKQKHRETFIILRFYCFFFFCLCFHL